MYDNDNPKKTSSLPDSTNCSGGFFIRAFINLKVILVTNKIVKIKMNKKIVSKLYISYFLYFYPKFQFLIPVIGILILVLAF
jgi:hypothetical protein